MGEIETEEAEKMGWLHLPRGTSYLTFPYLQEPSVAMVHTRVRLCYLLARVQWPIEK